MKRASGGRRVSGRRKSEKRGKRPGEGRERYSTLYREISIMRICNFNASPNPAKLPKRSQQQPQPSSCQSGASRFFPRFTLSLPSSAHLLRLVPRFLRLLFPTFSSHRRIPFPSSLSQNPITPRATSYVQQPNPHTRTRRVRYPPTRSNRFRVCCLWIFVSRFFLRLSFERRLVCLSSRSWRSIEYQADKLRISASSRNIDSAIDVIPLSDCLNMYG